jgi:phosphate transport system substrate-binding protein
MISTRLLFLSLIAAAPVAAGAQTITGAGSSLAAPIYGKWAEAAKPSIGIQLNYQAVGSGAGQKLIMARTVDFGASDAPVADAKLTSNKLLQFPTVMGAVDVIVNLPGIAANQLKLDGPTIANIYLGNITKWNDPAIAKLNRGVKLPSTDIAPVHRADGSGTTFVFTDYLSKVSPDWKRTVGAATAVSWASGTGAKGSDGVTASVKNTVGGIGYVESAYATLNGLTTVQLRNHDGKFLSPSLEAFAAAAKNADWTSAKDFAVDLNDQPGAGSWPIVTATFVLVPMNADKAKTDAVLKFFDWAYTNGDPVATQLQFVPLPAEVKTRIRAAWKTIGGA